MKETKDEKKCENCRYYSQYYIKFNSRYIAMHSGHCLHAKIRNKKIKPIIVCDFWEDIAIKKEERKQKIKDVLIKMSNRLEEVTMILKDDKDEE